MIQDFLNTNIIIYFYFYYYFLLNWKKILDQWNVLRFLGFK